MAARCRRHVDGSWPSWACRQSLLKRLIAVSDGGDAQVVTDAGGEGRVGVAREDDDIAHGVSLGERSACSGGQRHSPWRPDAAAYVAFRHECAAGRASDGVRHLGAGGTLGQPDGPLGRRRDHVCRGARHPASAASWDYADEAPPARCPRLRHGAWHSPASQLTDEWADDPTMANVVLTNQRAPLCRPRPPRVLLAGGDDAARRDPLGPRRGTHHA